MTIDELEQFRKLLEYVRVGSVIMTDIQISLLEKALQELESVQELGPPKPIDLVCMKCMDEGKTGAPFFEGGMTRTLMGYAPFYDNENRRHDHDGNVTTQTLRCSNGHTFTKRYGGRCWCGWRGRT